MLRKLIHGFYLIYVILFFLATLFLVLPFYFIFSRLKPSIAQKRIRQLTRLWCKVWLRCCGLQVQKMNAIPAQGPYVIIANHVSYLDPIIIFDVLDYAFKPLGKYEISKTPLFGFIYAQIAIMVDRSKLQSRARSMEMMKQLLNENCSVFLYPEGTFNESESPMKSFYDGAFRLAIEAQVPIVALLFPDTKKRWHYSGWYRLNPGKNRVYALKPFYTQGLSLKELPDLKATIHQQMSSKMQELQQNTQ